MQNVPQNINDLLIDYLDDRLTPEKRSTVDRLLVEDGQIRKRFEQLKYVHDFLQAEAVDVPSKNFTSSVMGRLDDFPEKAGLSMHNGLFLLTGILIAMGIGAWLLAAGVFDQAQTTLNLNQLPITTQYLNYTIPTIAINGKLVVNIIIFCNLAIALILLDRVILKPFFQRRIETGI